MKNIPDEHQPARTVYPDAEIAELSDSCTEKLRDFERQLNKQGYWNIALVAYQLKK